MNRLIFSFVACLLWADAARAQLVSPGDLVVTDLFGFTAQNLSVFDNAGVSQSALDLLSCSPFDVEVDALGTLFVSSGQTDMLYRLAPGASPDCTVVGHTGIATSLGIALSPSGTLFVVDSGQVFAIHPDAFDPGDLAANRVVVGSGGDLSGANDVAIDANGMLLVATNVGPVVQLDPDAYDSGNPISNQTQVGLGAPADATDIAISPAGELFVAEASISSRIVRYDPGTFDAMSPSANQISIYTGFSLPSTVAFDSLGRLLVLDSAAVVEVDLDTGAKSTLATGPFGVPFARLAIAPGALDSPDDVPALGPLSSAALVMLLCLAAFLMLRSLAIAR